MYPRERLDALSDAIFGVAMTLLVLDLRLPDDFHPADGKALLDALYDLVPKFIPYVLSFVVLGLRWRAGVRLRTPAEAFGGAYFRWWLLYLLFITCVPFSTVVMGRFPSLAPAIWVYAGNTALIAVAGFGMAAQTPRAARDEFLRDRLLSLAVLFGTSLLAVAWSFVNPRQALLALALNAVAPTRRKGAEPAPDSSTG
jgi:uncharacterized membrane protein